MNGPTNLLAKSIRADGQIVTLEAHSLDCERAAVGLFGGDSRWARSFGRFFRLDTPALRARLLLHLRVAGLFHDVGKANEDFYRVVSKTSAGPQTLRHEHLSALLLMLPEVRAWLAENTELDVDVVTAAVLSHHLKASEDGDWAFCQPSGRRVLPLYLDHSEVRAILERVRDVASLGEPPPLPQGAWRDGDPWSTAYANGIRSARLFRRTLDRDPPRRALLLATKVALIAADSAASGLVREGHAIDAWIADVVGAPRLEAADVEREVIDKRTADIGRRTGVPFKFHEFQSGAALAGPRVLLLAACAAGKTLAAWKWAAEQMRDRDIGRVIFLYPTRGTATEGYRDYVAWAPEAETALVHGTARYELDAMADNPSEAMRGKLLGPSEAEARLFSLGLWSKRWFSATVDQFLGFMEHQYGSVCLVPVLADAAVVVDEVHSFDRHMFDNLLAFLRAFDVPVLCMTATLPPSRRTEIERAGLRVYPTNEEREELRDLERLEEHPRYRLERLPDADSALATAVSAHREGRRVLWVVNTVARCQAAAARIEAALGLAPLTYHSRFRLSDRQRIHAAVVERFRYGAPAGAAIAVTTQVCEMSLDLDADVLITEHAPVSALVQRFGRANRHLARGPNFRAALCVYPPPAVAPYARVELETAAAFLRELGVGEVSQRDLAASLERHARGEPAADGSARFLDAGYFATPGALRDGEEFTQPCVLDGNLTAIDQSLARRQPIDGFVVAVPRSQILPNATRPPRLPKWLAIAPAVQYDPARGFISEERNP